MSPKIEFSPSGAVRQGPYDPTHPKAGLEETSQGLEIAPGVIEQRRFFLGTSLAAVAALFLGAEIVRAENRSANLNGDVPGSTEEMDFDEFVEECTVLAKQAAADPNLNEDAHLFRLAAIVARLQLKRVPRGKLSAFGGLNPVVEAGPLHRASPLVIIQWRMAPGATLPAHNHNPADVLTVCLEGECRVRHFDIVGEAPEYSSKETFFIRETQNLLLTPGRMSSLTQRRDNIHTFQAGEKGAAGIDINTVLPGKKPFSYLSFNGRPRDVEKRIFEASWMKL